MDFWIAVYKILRKGGRITREHPRWRNSGAYLFVDPQGNIRMHTARYGDAKFDYDPNETFFNDWIEYDNSRAEAVQCSPTVSDKPTGWPHYCAPLGSRMSYTIGSEGFQ